jgi:hypothetical protein
MSTVSDSGENAKQSGIIVEGWKNRTKPVLGGAKLGIRRKVGAFDPVNGLAGNGVLKIGLSNASTRKLGGVLMLKRTPLIVYVNSDSLKGLLVRIHGNISVAKLGLGVLKNKTAILKRQHIVNLIIKLLIAETSVGKTLLLEGKGTGMKLLSASVGVLTKTNVNVSAISGAPNRVSLSGLGIGGGVVETNLTRDGSLLKIELGRTQNRIRKAKTRRGNRTGTGMNGRSGNRRSSSGHSRRKAGGDQITSANLRGILIKILLILKLITRKLIIALIGENIITSVNGSSESLSTSDA